MVTHASTDVRGSDDADLINESSSTNPSREDLFSSVGAFDFISSSNHGRIVFDDGEDEESDDEDEAEESGIDSTSKLISNLILLSESCCDYRHQNLTRIGYEA